MKSAVAVCAVLLLALPLKAQFWSEKANPKVEVRLPHPPELGLRLRKVAFAPTNYNASRELADLLADEVRQDRRLEVMDTSRLDPRDDPAGSRVQVLVDVHHLRLRRWNSQTRPSNGVPPGPLIRTELEFSATILVTDPASGRQLLSRKFEELSSVANGLGKTLLPAMQRKVADWLLQSLLPWEEVVQVTFFDHGAYQMDRAAARLRQGDFNGANELALRGEAEARADMDGKARYRERATYNLGVAWMVLGEFEAARPCLQEARDMNPDASIFRDTLKECQRALEFGAALDRWVGPAAGPWKKGPGQRLLELERLLKMGRISQQDYQRRKDRILR